MKSVKTRVADCGCGEHHNEGHNEGQGKGTKDTNCEIGTMPTGANAV